MRFFPTSKQKTIVAKNDGAQRFVYNRLTAINNELYQLRTIKLPISFFLERIAYLETLRSSVSALQNSAPFLYDEEIDSQAVANGKRNYNKSWEQFHKVPGTGKPTFHKKGYEQSYQTNPHYRGENDKCNVRFIDARHITLPILGSCRIKGSPKLMKVFRSRYVSLNEDFIRIGTITVSMDACGDYFISMQTSDTPIREKLPATGAAVGIDLNVENFYTDSNGFAVDNPQFKRNIQQKLSKAQHIMSRRSERAKKENRPLRSSKNYQKSRIKTAKLHRQAARQREDFEHVQSKAFLENQDIVVAEDLKVKNMLKNHCLAYSMADTGWNQMLRMLDYKAKMYNKVFVKVPPHYTTQTCSVCGYVLTGDEKLTLDDREWVCPCCGTHHCRDHNSATVILYNGLAILSA